eukprot:10235604-Karenia_brevis.AAC.1
MRNCTTCASCSWAIAGNGLLSGKATRVWRGGQVPVEVGCLASVGRFAPTPTGAAVMTDE